MDGQIVGIRTSTIDEKCQAFDTLVVYCATLGGRFAPYLTQSLELSLPALKFYFHDGVREAASRCVLSSHLTLTTCTHACHRLIPLLFTCGKQSGTLTSPMVVASFLQLIRCIQAEPDPSFLSSLYRAVADGLRVVGIP